MKVSSENIKINLSMNNIGVMWKNSLYRNIFSLLTFNVNEGNK
jgi:hypothetical protein